MAHLVFSETQPNAEKPKEPFFCQRTDEQSDNNSKGFSARAGFSSKRKACFGLW